MMMIIIMKFKKTSRNNRVIIGIWRRHRRMNIKLYVLLWSGRHVVTDHWNDDQTQRVRDPQQLFYSIINKKLRDKSFMENKNCFIFEKPTIDCFNYLQIISHFTLPLFQ